MFYYDGYNLAQTEKNAVIVFGGSLDNSIPVAELAKSFDFNFRIFNKSVPELSIKDSLGYFTAYIKPMHPEASFLIFLDNREMPFASAGEMHEFYLEKAHLYLNEGQIFGTEGEKYMRLNVALPRADLASALGKLQQAYTEIGA